MFANLRRYATFVADVLRDNDKAEKYYEMAVKADPSHAINLGRYAFFLQTVRGDNGKAEELYQRAVDADSDNADILGNYANFLETVRNNSEYAMHVDVVDGRVFSVVLIAAVFLLFRLQLWPCFARMIPWLLIGLIASSHNRDGHVVVL